jgi:parallel beta-helix repeat protein
MEYYRVLDPGNGVTISHNILKNVGECAVGGTSSSPIIEYNKISYAGHELIDMHADSTHVIRNNLLGPNPFPGTFGIVIDSSSPTITNNTFVGCATNIKIFGTGSAPTIVNNTFEICGTDILFQTTSHNATIKDNTSIKCGESSLK